MSWLDEDEKLVGVAAPSSVSSSRQTNWLDEDEALLGIAPPKAEAGTFAQMAEGIIDLKTHNQKTWADNADIVIGKMEQAAGRPLEDRVKGHIYSEAQREALRLGGTPTPTLDEEKAQLGAAHAKGAGFLTNVSVGGTRALASFPLGAAGLIAPRKVAELEKAADDAGLYGTGAGGTVGSVLGNAIVMAPAAAAGAGTLLARAMPFMYGATAGGGARTNVARAKMEGTYDPLLDLGADSLNEFADVVVTAAAEYAFEKWGMNIALRGAGIGKALKDSLKASVAATGAEGLAKWFGQFAKTYGGKLAGVMLEGAGEESGTQLAQNISDKLFVRSKTPITAGIGEAAVAGGLAPVLMAPLGLTGAGGAATQTETAPPVRALPRPTFEEETAEVATAMDAGEQARYAPPGEVATGVAQGQEGNWHRETGAVRDHTTTAAGKIELDAAAQPDGSVIMYHGTLSTSADKIVKEGIAGEEQFGGGAATTSFDTARDYAMQRTRINQRQHPGLTEDLSIVVVRIPAEEIKNLGQNVAPTDFMHTSGHIPAEWIVGRIDEGQYGLRLPQVKPWIDPPIEPTVPGQVDVQEERAPIAHERAPEVNVPVPGPAAATQKQPWEMTRDEFTGHFGIHATDKASTFVPADRLLEVTRPGNKRFFRHQQAVVVERLDNKPIEGQDYNGAIDGINARVYTNDPAEVARFEKGHRAVVEDALAAGKPVPAEVLADYQDLAPTPGPAAAEAAPAGEDPRTSLQNAVVDKERLERGLAPLAPALRESWPESMAGALEEVGKNPKRPQELVANLATNPRPVSVHEEALIAIYKVQIRTDRGRISAEAEEAHRRGDTDALIDAQRRLALNEADMATTDLTTKVTGTAGARAFRFRAAMVAEDFSVEAMQTERRILNDFEPLSPEQLAEIDVLQAKIQAAEAAVAVAEERTRVAEAKRETYQIRRKGRPAAAVTEEARQRAKDRVASIDAEIASLKTDISRRLQGKGEGNIELRGAGLPLDTPTLGKMARLGYLYTKKGFVKFEAWSKAMLDSLGEDVRPHLDSLWLQIHQMAPEPAKEWKVNAARATRLTRQIEDYTGRIEARDYETRAKPELVEPSQEVLDLRYEAEKLKADWQLGNWKLKQSRRTLPQRTVDELLDLLPSAVTLRTAFDISGSGRQGGFVFTSHPIRSLKPFGHQFQAMTEKGYFDRTAKLRADSEYSDAVAAGIDFSEYGVLQAGTHTEEQLRGRLAQLIPGVRASSRAYVTFLNDLRLTYFKLLRHALPTDGRGTKQELNLLANLVNVATGRGTVKGHDQAIAAAARYFWAPRLAISRFQLTLLHPLWKGPWKGTWAARKIIAKEYLRYELGRRVLYALLTLAFMPAGMEVEWDPRSSAWGKIPVNNKFLSLLTVLGVGVQSYDGKMYLDPLAGASQAVVFMARMIAGETKTGRGEIRALRGDENRYGWQDVPKTIFNFGWGKLSPIPSTVISLAAGKNPVGDPINLQTSQGLKNTLRGLATPLVVDDIYEAFTNEPE